MVSTGYSFSLWTTVHASWRDCHSYLLAPRNWPRLLKWRLSNIVRGIIIRKDLTLTYDLREIVQRNTSIPIPKILDWSDDPENSVGSEYIIMEHAAGIPLQHKWPYMTGDQKVRCIDAIYKNLKQMVDINFPAYGCLYFSTTPLGSFSRLPLDNDFVLGPHCGTRYWDCGDRRYYQHASPNQGPCKLF